jgi:predicted transcriptional regulator
MQQQDESVRELVAEVAAAYFQNSHVAITEIPQVISQIAASLSAVPTSGEQVETADTREEETPRLTRSQIRRSIRPNALISFEDGRPYRTLTRHLAARGLTPQTYREKWGLPPDYPMVAAEYSAERAQMARKLGLGQRGLAARTAMGAARRGSRPAEAPAAGASGNEHAPARSAAPAPRQGPSRPRRRPSRTS